MRNVMMPLGALVMLAVIGAGVYLVMQGEEEPTPEAPAVRPVTPEPEVAPVDPIEDRHRMAAAFPFAGLQGDIDSLRVLVKGDQLEWVIDEQEHNIRVEKHKFTIQREQMTCQELVDELKALCEPAGINVTDLGRDMPDQWKIDVFMQDTDLFKVIALIMQKTGGHVRYAYSEYGVCIGTERTIQEWQIQSKITRAQEYAKDEVASPLLDVKVPPLEFEEAHIGAVIQKLRDHTGVEIVVSNKIWWKKQTVNWRTDRQMTLREVLERVAKPYRAILRVKDDRVFIIDP